MKKLHDIIEQCYCDSDICIKYEVYVDGEPETLYADNTPFTFVPEVVSINIIDAHEIKDDYIKARLLNDIMKTYDFKKRDLYSLLTEWKAHNILYKKGLFKKRTSDTGLSPKESWVRRLLYRVVCFIFTEK